VAERIGRLNELLSLLEGDVDLRVPFQKAFHTMLGETQAVGLFAEAGLHPRESLWSELARRVVERILPSAQADADLSKLVFQLHPDDRYISGFLDWPKELFERVVRALSPDNDPYVWNRQREDLRQAVVLLGTHVAEWACRQNSESGVIPTQWKSPHFIESSAWPVNSYVAVQLRTRKAY
jgi:site-specific recombinase